MGLNQRQDILYLNVSKGKLVNKQKNISGSSYTGMLSKIIEKEEEFQGATHKSIKLNFKDGKENAVVSFTKESWYSQGFFARIMGCDLTKPITVGVSGTDQNEKVSFCWVKQGDDVIKKDDSFPKPKKMQFEGKEITSYSDMLQAIDETLKKVSEKLESINFVKDEFGNKLF